jgi:hypothetical protein
MVGVNVQGVTVGLVSVNDVVELGVSASLSCWDGVKWAGRRRTVGLSGSFSTDIPTWVECLRCGGAEILCRQWGVTTVDLWLSPCVVGLGWF